MKMVFQVLEDILPELGIYTSVLKLIRDELYGKKKQNLKFHI